MLQYRCIAITKFRKRTYCELSVSLLLLLLWTRICEKLVIKLSSDEAPPAISNHIVINKLMTVHFHRAPSIYYGPEQHYRSHAGRGHFCCVPADYLALMPQIFIYQQIPFYFR